MRTLTLLLIFGALVLSRAPAAEEDDDYLYDDFGKPMLGIKMTIPNLRVQREQDLTPKQGVLVQHVYPGTAADDMGIQSGDVVVEVNGTPITSMTDLRNEVSSNAVGDPAQVTVRRAQRDLDLESYYGDWPEDIPYRPLNPEAEQRYRNRMMRRLAKRTEQLEGLRRLREKLDDNIDQQRQANNAALRQLGDRSPAELAAFAAAAPQRALLQQAQSEGFAADGLPAWRFRYDCHGGQPSRFPDPDPAGNAALSYGFNVDSEAL